VDATPELTETVQCLCLASRQAARAITRAFDRELRRHGLRATQFTLLAVLALKGAQTVGQLAQVVCADRTTMTRNVALAEERGLVEVNGNARDGRVRVVTITTRGRDALAAALASWGEVQAAITAQMGEDAANGLRRLARSYSGPAPAHRPA
jgi:DNA-binding MarR family transcriptional regulator